MGKFDYLRERLEADARAAAAGEWPEPVMVPCPDEDYPDLAELAEGIAGANGVRPVYVDPPEPQPGQDRVKVGFVRPG